MRKYLLLSLLACVGLAASAQNTATHRDTTYKLDDAAVKQLLSQLKIDTAQFLTDATGTACGCIDSMSKLIMSKDAQRDAIQDCIAEASVTYQGAMKVYGSMTKPTNVIMVSTRSEDPEFQRYYYIVESALTKECASLKRLLFTNDEITSESSVSNNKASRDAYRKGTGYMEQEKYSDAIKWLEKAVKLDPEFAFAWDNLGICYRRSNKLEKAVQAYETSLRIDSMGRTPLMNLAVAQGMLGRADDAIATYQLLDRRYPGDPETFYGIGRLYFENKKDYPAALNNLCEAYNLYVKMKSPYRSDAESLINQVYAEMKKAGQEAAFNRILASHGISPN
ncbi:MAG: tetratricopeptide repeat protein [Sphingobacteriales bacterium]|nr:MAG: tetratricopeptide repeat protein [Sphingobacteriales bacterium]